MLRSPGTWSSSRPAVELDRLAGVVLEEVDRLAHVGVRLGPRLGALAHLERRQLEPALAQRRRGARSTAARSLGGGSRAQAGAAQRSNDGARGVRRSPAPGDGDDALGLARIGRRRSPSSARRRRPAPAPRSGSRASSSRSASSSSLARGARRSSSTGSFANGFTAPPAAPRSARRATARAGTTRSSVLQQPAHEVRHAGHQLADRAVGAHAQPARGERLAEVVAEAAQHLQLEVAVVAAASRGCRRSRARPSAGCASAIATRTSGRRVEQAARQLLEVAVAVGLLLEHGRRASRAGAPPPPRGPSTRPSRAAPPAAGARLLARAHSRIRSRCAGESRRYACSTTPADGPSANSSSSSSAKPARASSRARRPTPCRCGGARQLARPPSSGRSRRAASSRPSSGASGRISGVSADTFTDRFARGSGPTSRARAARSGHLLVRARRARRGPRRSARRSGPPRPR